MSKAKGIAEWDSTRIGVRPRWYVIGKRDSQFGNNIYEGYQILKSAEGFKLDTKTLVTIDGFDMSFLTIEECLTHNTPRVRMAAKKYLIDKEKI